MTKSFRTRIVRTPGDLAELVTGNPQARDALDAARLQAQLVEQHAYNRSLIEASPDALFAIAPAGVITDVNEEAVRLTGHSRTHLIDSRFASYFTEPEQARAAVRRTLEERRVLGHELVLITRQGNRVAVSLNAGVFANESGAPLGLLAAARDITERKRFEQALQEKNLELESATLAKDRFLASMSHELRTPLTAVIGFTGTLLMRLPGPLTADQEQQLTTIERSAQHLLSLINDLLDVARIASGKLDIHKESTSCSSLIEEIAATLRPLADEKGLHFHTKLPKEDVTLQTDPRALRQIVLNLVGNAIKFTEKGSVGIELVMRGEKAHRAADIRVIDTGMGIKEEDQGQLFQAFTQLDASTTRRHAGSGLGLHLSQKLATLIDARISVESKRGKGSTFTLTIGGVGP
jgi:PAS domain S-box-containing protein